MTFPKMTLSPLPASFRFSTLLMVLFLLGTWTSASAQMRYGFKTGLNFAHIDGPSETGADGAALEEWKNITGFHIGATIGYKFSDNFSIRAEALFSKRGAKYTYSGPAYRTFTYDGGSLFTTGTGRYLINISNSYVDIPLMAVGRWGDFEISGGGYLGLLVASSGEGSLIYKVTDNSGVSPSEITFNLSHNYYKDDPGGFDNPSDLQRITVSGRSIDLPKTVGAYYDYPDDRGHLYNTLDYGLVGGVSYYLSRSLYAGLRLQYGLADVTRTKADLTKSAPDPNGGPLSRDDKDRNFAIQASVGFSF